MNDQSRVMISAVLGAVAGGLLGYLYLTESGKRVRNSLEPRLDDFMGEFQQMRRTAEKARDAVGESWRAISNLAADSNREWPGRAH